MKNISQEEALVRVIETKRRMLLHMEYMRRDIQNAVHVMAGLDEEFKVIYFSRKLREHERGAELPGSIPSRDELLKALECVGWTDEPRSTMLLGSHPCKASITTLGRNMI